MTLPNRAAYQGGGETVCADCVAACLRAKERGFRPWRGAFACYEHAAVNWDDLCAERGWTFEDPPEGEPDLFSPAPRSMEMSS